MSFSLNEVRIAGGVTRDPELRYTPSGKSVMSIGLAITDRRKDAADEQWKDHVTYVDATLWGHLAERAAKVGVMKGMGLFIKGHLALVDRPEGDKMRKSLKLTAEQFDVTQWPRDYEERRGGKHDPAPAPGAPRTARPETAAPAPAGLDDEDEVPF